MEINHFQIRTIARLAAELGAIASLIQTGHIRPYLNKNEAFKLYGRANVENWLKDGLITPRKDGDYSAAWRIERMEIELLVKSIEMMRLF